MGQSTNALYTELEQLSKAWEALEQQNHSKVFDLKDAELKVSRLTTEVSCPFRVAHRLLTGAESKVG